jgi:hypothetical protein
LAVSSPAELATPAGLPSPAVKLAAAAPLWIVLEVKLSALIATQTINSYQFSIASGFSHQWHRLC